VVLLLLTVTVAGAVPALNWFLVSPNELLIKTMRQTPNKNDTLLNSYATFNLRLIYYVSRTEFIKRYRSLHQRTLYLLRHGEIATPGILAGRTDVALSEKGLQQLWHTTDQLPDIAHCISSPLQRCQKFAVEFSDKNNIPLQLSQHLQEMNFGDWDGKQYQQLWAVAKNDKQTSIGDFWQNPWKFTPPNGELMADFVRRVDHWWQQWLSNSAQGNTLVVAHGGVIKHLIARVLNMPMPGTAHMSHIDVPYAGVIKITVYTDEQGKSWPKIVF
jgi:alpha-ribazole phosphatase